MIEGICRVHAVFLFLLLGASGLSAQSAQDRALIRQARTLYYAPSARPAYIACESTVDWDAVAKQINLPQTEGSRHGLELVKAMDITFVTRGRRETEVTVKGDARVDQQQEQMRQQITTFFQEYWGTSDGRMLPGGKDLYELTSTPAGYLIRQRTESEVRTLELDRSLVITAARIHATLNIRDMLLTPRFAKEGDGLLHLHGLLFAEKIGESNVSYEYSFDYQQVGGFYVPLHVRIGMPGALSYAHTFRNCQVFSKSNAPAPEPLEPR